SFVKFRRKASVERMGRSTSVPISDQVPELRNAVPSRAEIAATAEPVSCVAGEITGVFAKEVFLITLLCSGPITVPGSTMGASRWLGRSRRSKRSVAHVRVTGLTNWVVVAFVNSQTALPVSQ